MANTKLCLVVRLTHKSELYAAIPHQYNAFNWDLRERKILCTNPANTTMSCNPCNQKYEA